MRAHSSFQALMIPFFLWGHLFVCNNHSCSKNLNTLRVFIVTNMVFGVFPCVSQFSPVSPILCQDLLDGISRLESSGQPTSIRPKFLSRRHPCLHTCGKSIKNLLYLPPLYSCSMSSRKSKQNPSIHPIQLQARRDDG